MIYFTFFSGTRLAQRVTPAVTRLTVYRWLHIPVSNPLPQTPCGTFVDIENAFFWKTCSTSSPSVNQVDGLPLVAHNERGGDNSQSWIKHIYGMEGVQTRRAPDPSIRSQPECLQTQIRYQGNFLLQRRNQRITLKTRFTGA